MTGARDPTGRRVIHIAAALAARANGTTTTTLDAPLRTRRPMR